MTSKPAVSIGGHVTGVFSTQEQDGRVIRSARVSLLVSVGLVDCSLLLLFSLFTDF